MIAKLAKTHFLFLPIIKEEEEEKEEEKGEGGVGGQVVELFKIPRSSNNL